MAFTMRSPFRLTSALAGASKTAFRSTAAPVRSFHHSRPANSFFTSRNTTPITTLTKARYAFRQSRTYMQQPVAQAQGGNLTQKLVVGGAIFAQERQGMRS
ncbi:hypothetical protein BKA64DRAFT_330183 [Cadophora sp. MPI-SDFR-AT-0126]|nr:hypothetical protein BKA64DRAFT_330183 [Leotiomycetes sp. MPI-SDFR-AT-0126]